MEKYMVSLERFYGPLDLLLYLIEKNEMDIYDVSISAITDQYISYLRQMDEVDIEKMTSFLKMASFLLQLKAQMMLPKKKLSDEPETEPDPQEELIQHIILYKQYKQVASQLDQRQQDVMEQAFFRPLVMLPEISDVIFKGEKSSLQEAMFRIQRRRRLYQTLTLPFHTIRIETIMGEIWEKLKKSPHAFTFHELMIPKKERQEIAVNFLALLELMHQQKIVVEQRGLFDEITIRISTKTGMMEEG